LELYVRAIRYHSYGGPDVLQVDEVPEPVPAEGQVLIEVEAIGANAIDALLRRGDGPWTLPLPAKLTGEVVGRVTALGPGVTDVQVGARVTSLSEDAFADYVVGAAEWLAPVPDEADAGEATVLSMTGPLALRLLRAAKVSPTDTVLIHAAAGTVGHLALQLARTLGAKTIIGTTSTPAKLEFIGKWGADLAIDSSDPAWADQVRAAVPDGPDVILDAIGGEVFDRGLELLAPLGRMITYGAIGGTLPTIPASSLFGLKSVMGVGMLGWRTARPDQARADVAEVAELWRAGKLRTAVDSGYPLEKVQQIHEILDRRANQGRLIAKT
jgi:NADPH2:quinone reductase